MASFFIGEKKLVMMLFTNAQIAEFSGSKVADSTQGNEVLFSIGAESKVEVDEMPQKAEAAGGPIYAHGEEKDGLMYARILIK